MKLKGRTILVLCLLVFGGYAFYDFTRDKKAEEKNMEESRLLTVDFQHIHEVILQKGDQRIVLNRSTEGWNLQEPLKDAADSAVVEDFVNNTFPERVIDVAKEGSDTDWTLFGLDKPVGTITFKTTDGKQNSFEISAKRNFEENVFVRRDGENKVLVVNSSWQKRINKTVMDFRDRRFLRQRIASVDALRVHNGKGIVELKRVDGQWMSPQKKDLKLDQNKVRELLTTISEAKAAEIQEGVKKVSGEKRLFSLDLTMAEKKWHADVDQAKDLTIFASISEPQFRLRMEAGALDKLIVLTLEDLKEVSDKKPESKDNNDNMSEATQEANVDAKLRK